MRFKMFIIVDENENKLSGFYPNDLPRNQLKFRHNDWYSYSTEKEAKEHLKYIHQNCKMPIKKNKLRIKELV